MGILFPKCWDLVSKMWDLVSQMGDLVFQLRNTVSWMADLVFIKRGLVSNVFFLLEQYFREDLLSKTWARSPFQETWSSFWENRSPLQKIGFPILETGNRVSHSGHSVPFFINKTAVIYKNQAPLSPKKNKKQVPYSLNQVSY